MFSWVFFLATKDETSGILKTFITGIENQINHKVKIIRCDNGTEFKNNDMNQFCGMKGIKREFSVARTPQQNGVVKEKNRGRLIKQLGLCLADSLSLEDAVADDASKKTNEEPANKGERNGYANNTNRDSTVSPSVSTVGQSFTNDDDLPTNPFMPDLEDTADLLNTGIFSSAYDDEDVGAKADFNNMETTMNVSPIPITRIQKDHPKG
ncbi:putative ribonuclease H-like domain-containing protein [Tanacetum coccineum]